MISSRSTGTVNLLSSKHPTPPTPFLLPLLALLSVWGIGGGLPSALHRAPAFVVSV
jgi:hypothetical protein